MKKLELTGQRFTNLLVLEEIKERNKHGKVLWLCQCDCGNTIPVIGSKLIDGESKSCGCYSHDLFGKFKRKAYGLAAFNHLMRSYKDSAKRRNIVFELSELDVRKITKMRCSYCGKEPEQVYTRLDTYGTYIYNGIDRKDNSKGYIIDNCVPCCKKCNRMKTDMTYDEFISHMKKILAYCGEL